MSREIKFRAWNKAEGKMVDLQKITPLALDANMNSQLAMQGGSGLFIPFLPDMPIMQFTGLRDRIGVDVYEGDVVCAVIKGGHTYTGPIIFNQDFGQFCISMVKKFKYMAASPGFPLGSSGSSTNYKPYTWKSYKSLEVIGNIWESPDLLAGGGV